MVFASPIFLFLFLPLMLAAYFALPRSWRNGVLLVASLVFYAWGEARYLPLIVGSVAFNWFMGRSIGGSADPRARRRWLAAAIAGNLLALALFKYANFTVANVNALAPVLAPVFSVAPLALAAIPLPLGISFFTFHAISYVVDVYKRNAEAEHSIPRFALYILLFPQLIAGPIIRWRDIAGQLRNRDQRVADFAYGARRFVLGLGKKVLIANTLGRVADALFGMPPGELTLPLAWLGLACYTLQIYFDFSGYSDMAIGLMRMFGFRILENFNYPYIARSVREFWRRWHISLSNWFRDYLYIPLGGNQRGERRAYANLVIVFLLCGLWHGASWPFVLWGAWHGAFLVAERAGLDRVLRRIGPLAHGYGLAVVMGGWVLFRSDTLAHAVAYFQALAGFGQGDPIRHPVAQHLDPLVGFTLVIAAVFCTPLARRIGAWRDAVAARPGILATAILGVDVAWLACVGVLAGAFLAAGTYNPFIYFRF
ncbi:MAG TPA: MBOAT family O-acyltransferase [Casimicrobiaceae bacterium]|nr:MBOAT family O-acyltransferase [Casimicrobiaceae bacterium]